MLTRELLRNLGEVVPRRAALSFGLNVVLGAIQGVSLLLLLPLLALVGVGVDGGNVGRFGDWAQDAVQAVGLPLTLPAVLAVFVALQLSFRLLRYANERLGGSIASRVVAHHRTSLYDAVTEMEWAEFQRIRPSQMAHAITAEAERAGSATYRFLTVVSTITIALAFVAVAFGAQPVLTGFVGATAALLLAGMRRLNARVRSLGESFTDHREDFYDSTMAWLSAMKLVKSHGEGPKGRAAFHDLVEDVSRTRIDSIETQARSTLLIQSGVVLVLTGVVLAAVGPLGMSSGGLVFMLFLFARITPMASTIHSQFQDALHNVAAFQVLEDIEERARENAEPPEDPGWEPGLEEAVTVDDVTFRYEPHRDPVLEDFSCRVPAEAATRIQGPSGAGKTTLADLVMGFLHPDEGDIRVDGDPLTPARARAWRRCIGYVPQTPFLLNAPVRENLAWANPEASDEEMVEALEAAAAWDFVRALPEGLDTGVGDEGSNLSGGEQQRIALAMALVRKPDLLVLDEPTSELDRSAEEQILRALEDLDDDVTVLYISHRDLEGFQADHVIDLEGTGPEQAVKGPGP